MRSGYGIAAQAIGVAVLAAVVYFAFLHPGDPGPLQGIDVEDGTVPFPENRADREPSRTAAPRAERPATRPRPPILVVQPAASAPPPAGVDVDSPPGSQYADTVARILGRVSGSGP